MYRRVALVLAGILMVAGLGGCDEAVTDDAMMESLESAEIAQDAPDVPAEIPAAAGLLTPADVEQVSGLTGLAVVPYDPSVGAGGDVNIATAEGDLVAMLVVQGPEVWYAWLTDGFTVREPVTPPVGDESFIGPSPDVSEAVYIFGFLKGDVAVAVDTFFDPYGNGTMLSTEELRELAEIVESRL